MSELLGALGFCPLGVGVVHSNDLLVRINVMKGVVLCRHSIYTADTAYCTPDATVTATLYYGSDSWLI